MNAEAEHGRARRGRQRLQRGLQVVAGLLLFTVGVSVVHEQFERLTMHAYRVSSSAMEPALHCARPGVGCEADTADRVFVARFLPFWTPSRGDIIVFKSPPEARFTCAGGGAFVKRLIGLPGETVSERNGDISINGRPLQEPYVSRGGRAKGSRIWQIPDTKYFLLGDNRAYSCDSREFGSVARDDLVGPVVAFYWPLDRLGLQ